MKKITVGLTIVVVVVVGVIAIVAVRATGERHKAEAASKPLRERKFIKKGGKAPVKINRIRAKGRVVPASKPFVDSEDWVKGLSLELANASGKTVTFVSVQLVFPNPERELKKPGAAVFLQYGDNLFNYASADAMPSPKVKPVLPGDYVDLTLTDGQYETIMPLLATAGIPDHGELEIRVSAIGFSDGTAYSSGRLSQRNSRGIWLPVEPQTRKPAGVNFAHAPVQSPCRFGFPVSTECLSDPEGCWRTDFNLFDELPGDSSEQIVVVNCMNGSQQCSQ